MVANHWPMSVPGEVLIVDDDRVAADAYARWLIEAFPVRTAYDAAAALDVMDEEVAVVLLDRQLPERSGDELFEVLRAEFRCQIAFVSAVEPDLDIIPMAIDDYLVKPVAEQELYATVDKLMARAALAPDERSGLATRTKVDLLHEHQPRAKLAASTAFLELQQETVQRGPR